MQESHTRKAKTQPAVQIWCLLSFGATVPLAPGFVGVRVTQKRLLQTPPPVPVSLQPAKQPQPPPRTLAPVCLLREDPAPLNFLHFLLHHHGNHRLRLFRHLSLKTRKRGRGEGGEKGKPDPPLAKSRRDRLRQPGRRASQPPGCPGVPLQAWLEMMLGGARVRSVLLYVQQRSAGFDGSATAIHGARISPRLRSGFRVALGGEGGWEEAFIGCPASSQSSVPAAVGLCNLARHLVAPAESRRASPLSPSPRDSFPSSCFFSDCSGTWLPPHLFARLHTRARDVIHKRACWPPAQGVRCRRLLSPSVKLLVKAHSNWGAAPSAGGSPSAGPSLPSHILR